MRGVRVLLLCVLAALHRRFRSISRRALETAGVLRKIEVLLGLLGDLLLSPFFCVAYVLGCCEKPALYYKDTAANRRVRIHANEFIVLRIHS